MKNKNIFGIFRERSHSPEREYDDEMILRLTAEKLSKKLNREVVLLEPDEFLSLSIDFNPELVFFMCEETPYLEKLKSLKENRGCLLINSVEGVENTFRKEMLELLGNKDYFPKSKIVTTQKPSLTLGFGNEIWIKRGDYHAIEKEDVIFVNNLDRLIDYLTLFAQRGIETAIVQEHIPGDIIKFYFIRDFFTQKNYWFKWFYHKEQELKGYDFSHDELFQKCIDAGQSLELEIYGGDAIVRADGKIFIIDVNAWPSFALFREEASSSICQLLFDKLELKKGKDLKLDPNKDMLNAFSFSPQG